MKKIFNIGDGIIRTGDYSGNSPDLRGCTGTVLEMKYKDSDSPHVHVLWSETIPHLLWKESWHYSNDFNLVVGDWDT